MHIFVLDPATDITDRILALFAFEAGIALLDVTVSVIAV